MAMKKVLQTLYLVLVWIQFLPFGVLAAKPIRIGSLGPSGQQLPIYIAQDRGLFKKYSLDTEIIHFHSSTIMVPSLIAGEIQFEESGNVALVNSKVAGADVVTVAVYVDALPFTMVASEKIKSVSQLKGKRLGVGRYGTTSDVALRMVLGKLGIDVGKDVSIIAIAGSSVDRFAAMKTGSIDATVMVPPSTVTARKLGFNLLFRFQDAGIAWAFNTIDTTTSYARNNRETVLNFLKAVVEGIAYIHKNKQETLAVLSKRLQLNDRDALEETYDHALRIFQKKPFSSEEGIRMIVDGASRDNPKAKTVKPDDIVDMQYLRELDQSGFFEKIYK
jgi:NitT/TauT family transport system substrate-binding protein